MRIPIPRWTVICLWLLLAVLSCDQAQAWNGRGVLVSRERVGFNLELLSCGGAGQIYAYDDTSIVRLYNIRGIVGAQQSVLTTATTAFAGLEGDARKAAAPKEGNTALGLVWQVESRALWVYDGSEGCNDNGQINGSGYVYDDKGRAIRSSAAAGSSATVVNVTICYLVDTNNHTGYAQVVEESNGATGDLEAVFVYGHDLISQDREDGVGGFEMSFYSYDGLGSVRGLTDAIGTSLGQYHYDSYGLLIEDTVTVANPYLFAGERFDNDLGLYYLRARYLDVETGRFWSLDDFEGLTGEVMSIHKYLYAGANPVSFVDPSGFFMGTQAIGYEVEAEIEKAYKREFGFSDADVLAGKVSFGKWTRIPSVRTPFDIGVRSPRIKMVHVGMLKPDIFNRRDKLWNEIKPLSITGIAAGLASWNLYNTFLLPVGYTPDVKWAPNGVGISGQVTIPSMPKKPMYIYNIGGVLFYVDLKVNIAEVGVAVALNRDFLVRLLRTGSGMSRTSVVPSIRYAIGAAARAGTMAWQGIQVQMGVASANRL